MVKASLVSRSRVTMKLSALILIPLFFAIKSGNCVPNKAEVMAINSGLIRKLRYEFMFPLNDIVGPSLQLALTTCQKSFKWDRWNCPSSDFLRKRTSKHFDRESAYVMALTTAAIMHTITKNCSSGRIEGCGCAQEKNNLVDACSDNLKYAEEAIGIILHSQAPESLDVQAYAALHNERVVKLLLQRSLRRFCRCDIDQHPCSESQCWYTLRPFVEIGNDIRDAYERALIVKVDNKGEVDWTRIPEDYLVYVQDSPNYCNRNAIPGWTGTHGRMCSREKGKHVSFQERFSCRNLCRSCGLKIRGQSVIGQKRCNCHFSWCCEVKCDTCVKVERQYFCH